MKKSLILISSMIVLFSCNVRIAQHTYTRGLKANKNSILVLNIADSNKTDDQNIFISEMELKGSIIKKRFAYYYLLDYAKREAAKQGGNLIKPMYYRHGYFRSIMTVKIFYLDQNAFSKTRFQLDSSANTSNKTADNRAIVNIINYDEGGKSSIFFNDSLVGRIKGMGIIPFGKPNPGLSSFSLDKGGILRIDYQAKINITLGQAYYVVLYTTPAGRGNNADHYKLVNKEDFLNRNFTL